MKEQVLHLVRRFLTASLLLTAGMLCWFELLRAIWPMPSQKMIFRQQCLFLPWARTSVMPEPQEVGAYVMTLLAVPLFVWLLFRWKRLSGLPLAIGGGIASVAVLTVYYYPTDTMLSILGVVASDCLWGTVSAFLLAALGTYLLLTLRCRKDGSHWLTVGLLFGTWMIYIHKIYPSSSLYVMPGTAHFDILNYAVSQSAAGVTYLHQYGFYPFFLKPYFWLFPTGVREINVLFILLNCAAFLLLAFSVWKMMRNQLVYLFPLLYLIFFASNCFSGYVEITDPYFAYWPIRMMVPALVSFLVMWYLRGIRARSIPLILGVVCGVGVFWNFDSGIVCAIAVFCLFAMELWQGPRTHGRNVLTYSISLLCALTLTWFVLSLTYERWLMPDFLFRYQRIFAQSGFFMLPMPRTPEFWHLTFAVNGIGFLWGMWAMLSNRQSRQSRWVFFLSLMGFGLFLYYVGRSHQLVLSAVLLFPILIVSVLVERLIQLYGITSGRWNRGSVVILLFPVMLLWGYSFLTFLYYFPNTLKLGYYAMTAIPYETLGSLENDGAFIRLHAKGRKVNILGPRQGFLYAESGTAASYPNLSESEMFLNADLYARFQELEKANAPLFLVPELDPNHLTRVPVPDEILRFYDLIAISADGVRYFEPKEPGLRRRDPQPGLRIQP